MEVTPSLKAVRFAQLAPGDLFIMQRPPGSHLALTVRDPKAAKDPSAKENMVLLLNPPFSSGPKIPLLMNSQPTRVVSFSKGFKLRLPCDPEAWALTEPSEACAYLVLTNDKLYMRAVFTAGGFPIQCYVSIDDGVLLANDSERFAQPTGECAYTRDWAILTTEKDAREILSSRMLNEIATANNG